MNTGKTPKTTKSKKHEQTYKKHKEASKKVREKTTENLNDSKVVVVSDEEARSYDKPKKRIALIVSGQSRSPEMCWASQCNTFGFQGYELDYFVHSWSTQDLCIAPSSERVSKVGGGKFSKRINHLQNNRKELESKLIDIYNPVAIKVEDYNNENIVDICSRIYEASKHRSSNHPQLQVFNNIGYRFLNNHQKISELLRDTHFGQIYSIEQACKLKHDFEKKHNFKYDIVVKIRQDLFFPPSSWPRILKLQKQMQKCLESDVVMFDWFIEHDIDTNTGGFIGDIIFASNSETMDSLCLGITEYLTNSYIGIAEGTLEARTFIHPHGAVCIENSWPENILYNRVKKEKITCKKFHFPHLLYRHYMKKLPQKFDELRNNKEHFEKYGHLFTQ